jgi:hydrogenase maturation protein HypF
MGVGAGPLPDDPATIDHPAAAFLGRLDAREVALVRTQVRRRLNAPVASSAGRLFDAASSLIGLRDVAEFEAQAAIDLELAAGDRTVEPLAWRLDRVDDLLVYDPRPTLAALLDGVARGRARSRLAAGFQAAVADVTVAMLHDARTRTGVRTVCLSGGVFQNRRLAAMLLRRLAGDGFEPYINRQVPVNDGGVSYGQAAIAAARLGSGASTPVQED